MSRSRVLFLGHIASRTGAPIMLLSLLRWLKGHSDIGFDVALQYGGPLVEDYGRLSRVFVVHHGRRWPPLRDAVESARNLFRVGQFYRPEHLMTQLARRDIGLIYANTVGNGAVLSWLSRLNCPVVCHAHDVETSFQMMSEEVRSAIKYSAQRFVAVTPDIAKSLVACGVSPERIAVVPGFLAVDEFADRARERRQAFRRRLGIAQDVILIGGCGTLDWRKGPDLFVQIARSSLRRRLNQPMHFVWAGGDESENDFKRFAWDVAHAGLADHVSLVPSVADTAEYFNSLDVFALPSRDDPFPLVAVEAGACERPVVCFAGNAKFVDAQSGVVVPFLDVEAFADAVCRLASNESQRQQLGRHLAQRIREQHDVSLHAPRIVEIIRSFVA